MQSYDCIVPTGVLNLMGTPDLISVELTWHEPSPPNGVITNYTITFSVNGSSTITGKSIDTRFKIAGLRPQTVVSGITVTASTRIGSGPLVTYRNITTLDGLRECYL